MISDEANLFQFHKLFMEELGWIDEPMVSCNLSFIGHWIRS